MSGEAVLGQVRVLVEKHEALAAASGEGFNLFEILGRETDEVRTHSAVLGELLDPGGSHGQGAVFARLFAQRFEIEVAGIDGARVEREKTIDEQSRADIVLETGTTRVVIENKIHAPDRKGQLERYFRYADAWPTPRLFYLTLDGREPGEDSLGGLQVDCVECISYESDVVGWLEDCIKEVARVPQVREILAHYQGLLRKLTGRSTGALTMEMMELLGQRQGDRYNFELAPGIAEAMTAFSVDVEWQFWQALREALLVEGERPWRLRPVWTSAKEVSEEVIRHAHRYGRNRWYYGWTFRIEGASDLGRYRGEGVEVLLRVECDGYGWGFYGLIAVEETEEGMRQMARSAGESGLFERWAETMQSVEEGWYTGSEWWLAWTWPSENVDMRKGLWLAPDVIRSLLEEDRVSPLVGEIQASIGTIESLRGGSVKSG